jgi:hypothetical protein
MVAEFSYTLPVIGVALIWKPLTLGQEIEIDAQHRRVDNAHLKPIEVIRRRITSYGDKPVCTLEDMKAWDTIDYEDFCKEIEEREAERKASFIRRKSDASPGPVAELEAVVMEMRATAQAFLSAADRAILAIKSVPPLGAKKP